MITSLGKTRLDNFWTSEHKQNQNTFIDFHFFKTSLTFISSLNKLNSNDWHQKTRRKSLQRQQQKKYFPTLNSGCRAEVSHKQWKQQETELRSWQSEGRRLNALFPLSIPALCLHNSPLLPTEPQTREILIHDGLRSQKIQTERDFMCKKSQFSEEEQKRNFRRLRKE